MGKWDWLKGKYPELQNEDPKYRDAVRKAMEPYRGKPAPVLAEAINLVEERKAEAKKALDKEQAELTALETLLLEELDRTGMQSFAYGGYRFTPSPKPYPKVVDREALREYMLRTQKELLNVNSQTLYSLVVKALEEPDEHEMPEGVEITNVHTTLSRKKA